MKYPDIKITLEHLKERPAMWIHPVSISSLMNFLGGFRCGYSSALSSKEPVTDHWFEAQKIRGWKCQATGPVEPMREAGLSDVEIMRELVEIEMLTAKCLFDKADDLQE